MGSHICAFHWNEDTTRNENEETKTNKNQCSISSVREGSPMTLDDLELLWIRIFWEFRGFRRFGEWMNERISRCMSETVRDRGIVTMVDYTKSVYYLLNHMVTDVWPLMTSEGQFSSLK